MKTAVFLYEPAHVGFLSSLPTEAGEERVLIACGADIEFLLEEKGVSFVSARPLRATPVSDRLIQAEMLGRALLQHPLLEFFSYRGIHIGRLFTPALQYYLSYFLYHADIIASALEAGTYNKVELFTSTLPEFETGGVLNHFEVHAFEHAARLLCAERDVILVTRTVPAAKEHATLKVKRFFFGWALRLLNVLVLATVRQKDIKILASENWKNIEQLMGELPESELILLDRAESLKVGIRTIWRNRIRFLHAEDFLSHKERSAILSSLKTMVEQWGQIREKAPLFAGAQFRGYPLESLLCDVLEQIVTLGGREAVEQIEATFAMYAALRPDLVVVRAGVSAQIHFTVLCRVARMVGIPSLEIQHGTLYFGPESASKDRAAEYVAEYGPQVREDLKTIGYDDEHLIDVGSPRFDLYSSGKKNLDEKSGAHSGLRVLCIVPDVATSSWTDSYSVIDYFQKTADALQLVPESRIALKLRPVKLGEEFHRQAIRRIFKDAPHTVVQYEPLIDLFDAADVVVSGYSTVLLESLLYGMPTVYFSAQIPTYDAFASMGENAKAIAQGALLRTWGSQDLARTLEELKDKDKWEALAREGRTFMESNFSFDGKSAPRLAEAVWRLAKK